MRRILATVAAMLLTGMLAACDGAGEGADPETNVDPAAETTSTQVAASSVTLAGSDARLGVPPSTVTTHQPIPEPSMDEPVMVLAHDIGWRPELRQWDNEVYAILEIVDEADVGEVWNANIGPDFSQSPIGREPKVRADIGAVDLDRQTIVVVSQYGSTCPEWPIDLRTDGSEVRMWFEVPPRPGGLMCEDILMMHRFVVAVDRHRLPDTAALPLDEIVVVTENDKVRKAVVTTYPAA